MDEFPNEHDYHIFKGKDLVHSNIKKGFLSSVILIFVLALLRQSIDWVQTNTIYSGAGTIFSAVITACAGTDHDAGTSGTTANVPVPVSHVKESKKYGTDTEPLLVSPHP